MNSLFSHFHLFWILSTSQQTKFLKIYLALTLADRKTLEKGQDLMEA